MEKEYYIPEMEEFCIGFEYQMNDDEDGDWNNYELDENMIIPIWSLKNELVRVKYLDKEDIEQLGWQYVEDKRGPWMEDVFIIKDHEKNCMDCYYNTWYLLILLNMSAQSTGNVRIRHLEEGGFVGGSNNYESPRITIKNKSELRKIMQMLKIKTK